MIDKTHKETAENKTLQTKTSLESLFVRLGILLLISTVFLILWLSSLYFTEKFSKTTRITGEQQIALYSGRLISEIQRSSVVPLLLSQDTKLINALETQNYISTSQRLMKYQQDTRAKSIFLLDKSGRTVAASDTNLLGINLKNEPLMSVAMHSKNTIFTTRGIGEGRLGFYYSHRLTKADNFLGVIIIEVDIEDLFSKWSGQTSTIIVTNSNGIIILSTKRQFLNQTLKQALAPKAAQTAVQRAIRATGEWGSSESHTYLSGKSLFRLDADIPFQGWKLTYLTSKEFVRSKVNGIIALEVMALSLLLATGFYLLSRRAIRQAFFFKTEFEDLRALNEKLSSETSQRERAERELEVAEQSLAQSSKLAALGEMSAAVSHELNQPLAAMRTYLAGAKILLQRNRPEQAASSFQRIDDLIGRMAAITKQLKSYARKGSDELQHIDMRNAINDSLSMMAAQLDQSNVQIDSLLPKHPVIIMGNQIRVEQVIVNLLRNALDAMKGQSVQEIQISLISGETAILSIQDNGPGIENLDNLFEPFFTTKNPGDGIGLGLAISSGIAKDLGGRLIARNVSSGGAVFELSLPQVKSQENQVSES